jgi:CHAT domain-containing protein/Tfp pilus assembly protein PilF
MRNFGPHRFLLLTFLSLSFFLALGPASLFAQPQQPDPANTPLLSPVERALKGGETNSYRVTLKTGQFLNAVVEQKGIDVVVSVSGPDGKQITESDSPNDRWGPEPILLIAETDGDYRVDIRSPSPRAPAASYAIKVNALRQAIAADKDYVTAQKLFDEGRKLRVQPSATARRASIEKYQAAIPLFHAAGDTYKEALTLSSIGNAYNRLNEFRKALPFFNQALSLVQQLNDRRLEGGTETFLGFVYDVLGEPKKALEHYERALSLSKESGNQSSEAAALNNIGLIHNQIGEGQTALEYYARALALNKALGVDDRAAIVLHNIGLAYLALAEPEKALDYFQQALTLRRATKDKAAESAEFSSIGLAYSKLENWEKALDYFNQALTIQRTLGDKRLEAATLDYIGNVYRNTDKAAKALEFHQQALPLQLTTEDRQREAVLRRNIGYDYYLLGDSAKALEYFNEALTLSRTIEDRNSVALSLEGLARVEQGRGDLVQARKNTEDALALIETVRARSGGQQSRAAYLASKENTYELYIDLLMKLHAKAPGAGHDAEALRASERGRARSLLELLNEAKVDIRQGVGSDLVEKERELSQALNAKAERQIQLTALKGNPEEIATLRREISGLEDEYQQVQVMIRKNSPQYAALTQPQPLGLKEIQQQLDPNTLLLEYSLGDARSFLWAITSDSMKSFELPKRAEIENLARQVYESLTVRGEGRSLETPVQRQARIADADAQFKKVVADLSRMILTPARAEFGSKRLVVVADGGLQYVPFAALSLASGPMYRPLVLGHEVISLPSASALAIQRQNLSQRPLAPRGVAVIADPVFSINDARVKARPPGSDTQAEAATRIIEHLPGKSGQGRLSISRLPFTRQEADRILAVAPGGSNLKALDFRANRSLATSDELSKYRYVHFATHGYLDTARAGLSAIVLSMFDEQGKPQDGFLRTHDIYNLKLPAELVVLSACETGLGKDVKGEGIEGLTRGFMYAGARRVIVSLWNVNDKATAELMQHLYTGMLRSSKTPAAALRAAQIEMLRLPQWRSPYFWAAFVMQGEWN